MNMDATRKAVWDEGAAQGQEIEAQTDFMTVTLQVPITNESIDSDS